ncbi:MAG: AAA family ATPase [Myxococcales bacterium]|nr:AAA family ATPase [Myxococcales bacterium]
MLGTVGGFVGRAQALADLASLVDRAAGGIGGITLVAGDPGIGKTRLATELATRRSDVHAVWGTCWEGEGAPALWPWVQVVREVARRHAAIARAPILGRLHPELGEAVPAPLDEQTRFQLFDAIAAFLRAAAAVHPLLVIVDDLHWADRSSLLLLGFLVGEVRTARIAVVGTYRDLEVPPGHALHQLVSTRTGVIPLHGLAADEVAELVRSTARDAPAPAATELIVRATGGNPFFVREMLRMPDLETVPESVGEVIRRRAAKLSPAARALIDAVSVIGHRCAFDVLARIASPHPLAEVVAARLLEDEGPTVRFPHALVREVLYRELPVPERTELHRRAGEVLASLGAEPAELAYHFARSEQRDQAIDHAERAGHRALGMFAYEDAATQFDRALAMLPLSETGRRAELSFALGRAHHAASHTAEAHAAFERVAQLSPPPELLAETALAFAVEFTAGVVDPTEVRLLEQALAALPATDHPLRARVLARLAKALLWTPEIARRVELSETAVAMARRIGDEATLAAALYDRHVALWGGPEVEERLAIASEVVALAEKCGDPELAVQGQALRIGNLLELGDMARVNVEIEAYDVATTRLRQPHYLWHLPLLRSTLAALACQFDRAEELARIGLAMARRAQHQAADVFYGAALSTIRFGQGRFGELEPMYRAAAAQYPSLITYRSCLALVFAETGRREEARHEIDRLLADPTNRVPRDFSWVASLALLSLAAGSTGDRAAASVLYDLLLPYERTCVRVTRIGIAGLGAVAHFLGVLASTLGDWERARTHLERAIDTNLRIGAPAYVANSRFQLARALRATGHEARASEELQRAEIAASTLGLTLMLRHEPPRGRTCVLRREGELWTVRFRRDAFRLKDSIGVGYLARLLGARPSELHVLELSGQDGASSGMPVLDPRAKAELKARLADLDDQVADAEARGDRERARRAREEIDAIAEELALAVGIGGRDRRAGSEVERARMRVTKAIKAVIRRIADHDAELADHLDHSLKTGAYCSYAPEAAAQIQWEVTT